MYPARATLQHVIKAWWKAAGKILPGPASFFFGNEHILRSCPVPIIPLCLFMSLLSSQRSKEAKKKIK